jgi:site-specific DNA-adenine methylase
MVKFFPSFVGSKAFWVPRLSQFKGRRFVEPFCGSAVLSANLASSTILNDLDPYVTLILKNFLNLEVPEVFTAKDYFEVRVRPDWWRWAFCLQKMSFSGVFRYSRNGYNVPIKKDLESIAVREDYEAACKRWLNLRPEVHFGSYLSISLTSLEGAVVVFDPPYENSKASYNSKSFDYNAYWEYVEQARKVADVVVFDSADNLLSRYPDVEMQFRKMRVNGRYKGGQEALALL